MLIWETVNELDSVVTLVRANVFLPAVDGTPVLLLKVHATPWAYDVQTAEGFVLAHDDAYTEQGNIEAFQVHAQAAAREIVCKLLGMV